MELGSVVLAAAVALAVAASDVGEMRRLVARADE
jgi:hypothetical protein